MSSVVHNRRETRIRTDHGLPCAGSPGVPGQLGVRLETYLSRERGLDLALVAGGSAVGKLGLLWPADEKDLIPGEEGATELSLNEELGVKELGGGVERSARDSRVDAVRRGNGVPLKGNY